MIILSSNVRRLMWRHCPGWTERWKKIGVSESGQKTGVMVQ